MPISWCDSFLRPGYNILGYVDSYDMLAWDPSADGHLVATLPERPNDEGYFDYVTLSDTEE